MSTYAMQVSIPQYMESDREFVDLRKKELRHRIFLRLAEEFPSNSFFTIYIQESETDIEEVTYASHPYKLLNCRVQVQAVQSLNVVMCEPPRITYQPASVKAKEKPIGVLTQLKNWLLSTFDEVQYDGPRG